MVEANSDEIGLPTTWKRRTKSTESVQDPSNPWLVLGRSTVAGFEALSDNKRGADLLFQVVAARYESGSIVLTTNRAFREWGTLFDVDNTLATALIDRLMHHGEALVIKGDSYRMKDKDNPADPPSA